MIVLASQSAARRKLLEAAGVAFIADPATVDEALHKRVFRKDSNRVDQCAVTLAGMKASEVAQRHPNAFVIGADQILACGDEWFAKPTTVEEARAQLQTLRGRAHVLATGVVVARNDEYLWWQVPQATLTMRDFSDEFLDAHIARMGERIFETVGGYELEGPGVQLFEKIEGDFFSIVGLPLLELLGVLRSAGAIPR